VEKANDCVVIAAGTPHKLWSTGPSQLVLLCCCAPACSDDDTVMTGR
jgi:mannose-6-phosphate isomerase-like protein (cupin superfamily)